MLDLIRKIFNQPSKGGGSSNDAKQRLKFLLVHDEVALTPAQLDMMKNEIMEVIKRYVEFDAEGVEFRLDKGDGHIALVSNVPVRRVNNARS